MNGILSHISNAQLNFDFYNLKVELLELMRNDLKVISENRFKLLDYYEKAFYDFAIVRLEKEIKEIKEILYSYKKHHEVNVRCKYDFYENDMT